MVPGLVKWRFGTWLGLTWEVDFRGGKVHCFDGLEGFSLACRGDFFRSKRW